MLTEINITAIEPFAEGASFGNTGAYERVRGTYTGALDPFDARNQVIVNIDKAPRNARGHVEYEGEFFILRPVDAARGSGKILYDVLNRGRKGMHTRFMDAMPATLAESNDPKTLADTGNGLLLRRGYTLVWSSLDPDAPRSNNGMSMNTIFATNNGAPIERVIRDGSYFPFATTGAEREAKNDPRPSLEERYGSHAGYVRRVEKAAQALVTERLLLQEDAERLVERAKSAEIAKRFTPASTIAASAGDVR